MSEYSDDDADDIDDAVPSDATLEFTSRIAAAVIMVSGVFWTIVMFQRLPWLCMGLVAGFWAYVLAEKLRGGRRVVFRTAAIVSVGMVMALARFPGLVWTSYRAWRDRSKTVKYDITVGVMNDGTVSLDTRPRETDSDEDPVWTCSNFCDEDVGFLIEELTAARDRAARLRARAPVPADPKVPSEL